MHDKRHRRERGSAVVEFALVTPFLVLLLFGTMEFAWVFAQHLDVRHGTREAGRLAAVNYPELALAASGPRTAANRDALVAEICSRMELGDDAAVELSSSGGVDDPLTVRVSAPADTLTGFMDWALPPTLALSSEVESRVEQPATWENTTGAQPC